MHYLLIYDVVEGYAERRFPFRAAHLAHARQAVAHGDLVLAGALANPVDGAVLLFRASSPVVAEAFAAGDPYVRNGLVTNWRVREWTTVLGAEAEAPLPDAVPLRPPTFPLRPIGTVRSRYTDTTQIPRGLGAQHEAEGVLELLPELETGLTDIEGFSHLYVLWIFDRTVGYDLLSVPPTDDRPHGVFATRAPRRPNQIGLTAVRLVRREGPRLVVRGVDMVDGTPIVDIKPYLTSVRAEELRRGWLAEAEMRADTQRTGSTSGTDGSAV